MSTTDLQAITGDIRDIPQQKKRVIPDGLTMIIC